MAQVNRHLRGDTKEVEVDVHGNTVIEKGDIVWIYKINGSSPKATTPSGRTTADWYAYPASYLSGVTKLYFDTQFAGITMKGSASGTTEKIPVATSGIFRMPLKAQTGVTIAQLVCGATSAATTLYDQMVVSKASSEITDEYGLIIGVCVKTQASAANVDFNLITQFSGVSYAYIQAY